MLNKNLFNGAVAEAGLTHKELAKKIGMSKNTLSSRVNGKTKFNADEIEKACDVLNICDNDRKVQIFLFNPSQNRDNIAK